MCTVAEVRRERRKLRVVVFQDVAWKKQKKKKPAEMICQAAGYTMSRAQKLEAADPRFIDPRLLLLLLIDCVGLLPPRDSWPPLICYFPYFHPAGRKFPLGDAFLPLGQPELPRRLLKSTRV